MNQRKPQAAATAAETSAGDAMPPQTPVVPGMSQNGGHGSGNAPTEARSGLWPPFAPSRRENFVAGTVVAKRYRIVTPLGRGGMGDVWRADDLELKYSVALKFLPEPLSADPASLQRLRSEVRVARQIAHPNVCRVYDIASDGSDHFLTMEYVDGEDLASVLRRLGRPSTEKALELARQICAGLHAAHELGVLHRDLKPANVMLDGRGRARITDFGLAGLAEELVAKRQRAGTPAYMAPEQFERGEVSSKSDIYSLGLVLYELFTGKPAFDLQSIEKLGMSRATQPVTSMTSLVQDLDPAIEACITRCLEADPKKRPASALTVAASLPGGDPLAAALAAGETPSPQLVAAAAQLGMLKPAHAFALLGVVLAGLITWVLIGAPFRLINRVPAPKSPDVLLERATEVVSAVGYDGSAKADRAWGFSADTALAAYVQKQPESSDRWKALEREFPSALRFWYRQSKSPMLAVVMNFGTERVSRDNPPMDPDRAGMIRMDLAPDGRLLSFLAIPPRFLSSAVSKAAREKAATTPTDSAPPTDAPTVLAQSEPIPSVVDQQHEMTRLARSAGATTQRSNTLSDAELLNSLPPRYVPSVMLAALSQARLNAAQLAPSEPIRTPPVSSDERYAWTGTFSDGVTPLRVEAASFDGKLVFFETLGPWNVPEGVEVAPATGASSQATTLPSSSAPTSTRNVGRQAVTAFQEALQLTFLIGTSVLVAVNMSQRRGDLRGALRVAVAILVLAMLEWLLGDSRLPRVWFNLGGQFMTALAFSVLSACLTFGLYVGLEPYLRRRAPYRLVSWTRLLEGRWMDPLVGRDLLIGLSLGTAAIIFNGLLRLTRDGLVGDSGPVTGALSTMLSVRYALAGVVGLVTGSLSGALAFLILPLILQIVTRKWWLATGVFWLIIVALIGINEPNADAYTYAAAALAWGAVLLALYRVGVIAGAAAIFVLNLLAAVPVTADLGAWYASPTIVAGVFVLILAAWGCYVSLAGKSIFGEGILKA